MINIDVLLAYGAAYKNVSINEAIFNEGHACSFYYQLVSGRLRWVNTDNEGKECIHSIVEAGECFGEMALFDDKPYIASVIADEESVVIRLHKPDFLELIKNNSDINFSFTKIISKMLRFKISVITSLASHSPENTITNLLNYLKAENKSFFGDRYQLNLTRQQIAGMTGLRVETVIRTMRNMHDNGKLEILKGKVFCSNRIHAVTA